MSDISNKLIENKFISTQQLGKSGNPSEQQSQIRLRRVKYTSVDANAVQNARKDSFHCITIHLDCFVPGRGITVNSSHGHSSLSNL